MGLKQIGLKAMGILSMGRIKANRLIISKPTAFSAEITEAETTKVVITFDQPLDLASVPATTTFAIIGKIISNVAIVGSDVILTVTIGFDYGDVVTVDYTKPLVNMIKSATGGQADSFTGLAVTNNTLACLADGNTFNYTNVFNEATITKDGGNLVSQVDDVLGGGVNLIQADSGVQPLLTADGLYFNGNDKWIKSASFTKTQPITIYLLLKQVSHAAAQYILDGNTDASGALFQNAPSPNINSLLYNASPAVAGPAIGSFGIIRIVWNGAASTLRVNEGVPVTWDTTTSSYRAITFGARGTAHNQGADFTLRQAIFRSGVDNATNITNIVNYLNTKI